MIEERKRIDSHIHLFERGYANEQTIDAELNRYETLRGIYNIDSALVVGYEGRRQFLGNNNYILRLAEEHDWIVPLSYLSPESASTRSIEIAVEAGAAGFSVYLGSKPNETERFLPEIWKAIDKHSLLLSVNSSPGALPGLASVIREMPNSPILISHLGLPGKAPTEGKGLPGHGISGTQRVQQLINLAPSENVFVKLTGLYAIDSAFPHVAARPDVDNVIERFGVSRLVWGSDYSPALQTLSSEQLFSLPEWLTSQMSEAEMRSLTRNTLRNILQGVKSFSF